MSRRTALSIVAVIAVLATLLFVAKCNQGILENGLPPRDSVATTQLEARGRAYDFIKANGGESFAVIGTGSMAPYIRAEVQLVDGAVTYPVVAYAVSVPGAAYADIVPGKLCVYAPDWKPGVLVMHQAALKQGEGWVMSGYGNKRSESWARVTPANFKAIVARVFVWEIKTT